MPGRPYERRCWHRTCCVSGYVREGPVAYLDSEGHSHRAGSLAVSNPTLAFLIHTGVIAEELQRLSAPAPSTP